MKIFHLDLEELRNLGHDVLTAFEDNKASLAIPDEEFLARAIELNRIVLTHNRIDFKRLHNQNSQHFGIVICTENNDRFGLANRIHDEVSEYENVEGELVRVYRPFV